MPLIEIHLLEGRTIEQKKKLLASYIHLHLGSLPSMALRFVENCRQFRDICNCRELA